MGLLYGISESMLESNIVFAIYGVTYQALKAVVIILELYLLLTLEKISSKATLL